MKCQCEQCQPLAAWTYCQEFRLECLARHILNLPKKLDRIAFLNKQTPEMRKKLEAEMLKQWREKNAKRKTTD